MAVILVMGASRGIGRGLVRACVARGDRVIATVRQRADGEALRAEGAEVLVVDVADPASVSGLAWQLDGQEIDCAWYVAGVWDAGTAGLDGGHEGADEWGRRDRMQWTNSKLKFKKKLI